MNGHHLVMGEIDDFVTGRRLPDTHDERYRQKIARILVEQKGYRRDSLDSPILEIRAAGKCAWVPITWTVRLDDRIMMLVHYGPGSLVTRHRPALAMGRLVAAYQIPVVVVSNGEEADVLDGSSGKLLAQGLAAIPSAEQLVAICATNVWAPILTQRVRQEERIVMAYEVDDRCPCDDTVCRINEMP